LRIGEIEAMEPARVGGSSKMHPLKTGFEIAFLIVREFVDMLRIKTKTVRDKYDI
jgi:hypothetical protein